MTIKGSAAFTVALAFILAYALGRFAGVAFDNLRNIVFERVGQDATRALAEDVFARLHRLSLRFHLARRTGEVTKVIERGTKSIDTMLYFMLFNIAPTVLQLAIVAVIFWTPPEPRTHKQLPRGRLAEVLGSVALLRLNFGVFVLHAVQLAMWLALPVMLVQAGLGKDHHWQVYLPAVLGSFVLVGGVFAMERRGHLKKVFLLAIALIAAVQLGFLLQASGTPRLGALAALLFVFFCGFNVLEATQPSLASRLAPSAVRGTAMGVYNTLQSLGFFAGGWLGGYLVKTWGSQALFLSCAGAMLAWLLVALPMQAPGRSAPVRQTA